MSNEKIRAHILAFGRVQGVFYRASAKKVADKIGICGCVKNLPDGSVELLVEGEKEKVEKMIDWCKKGPFLAKVNRIEVDWQDYVGDLKNFQILYD
jgi:acylphosphatase